VNQTEKAISELGYFLDRARVKLFGVDGLVTEGLRILAGESRAMADVRTLDDWATNGRWHQARQREVVAAADGEFLCVLGTENRERNGFVGFVAEGATPDEARAKAAAWVRERASASGGA
jgi:hypothetical protein